jgi:hypothetical protein
MGSVLAFVAVAALPVATLAGDSQRIGSDELDRLLDAIARVESRHDPSAMGDGGKAAGVYQIHRDYWADGTKFLGVAWDYSLATDPVKAREVVRAYLLHYGRGCTLLEMARIHNGGPTGCRKGATLAYARKIARVLNDADPA